MVRAGVHTHRSRGAWVTLVLAAVLVLLTVATAASASPRAGAGPVLDADALQEVLLAQDLPALELLPVTETSHPFNGAAWQNKPIDLKKYGYVEREYLMSGTANVYGWVAGSDFSTQVLRDGPVRHTHHGPQARQSEQVERARGRRADEHLGGLRLDGHLVGAVGAAARAPRRVRGHHVQGGRVPRHADLRRGAVRRPGDGEPAAARGAGRRPLPSDDASYDPNYSKLYENGLVWDIATQAGRLLKSSGPANPLRRAAKTVILSGESQQGNVLVSYYKWFTPAAYLKSGRPIFDGYLSECFVNANPQDPAPGSYYSFVQAPINQTEPLTNPLPADDPQLGWVPARPVPFAAINSQWDYSASRGFPAPQSFNTRSHKAVFWELAGCNHGWEWQYLYGDACAADLLKAGFWDPATYNWSTTPNNPEVPLYMAEKALYRDLLQWIKAPHKAPPVPATIESVPNDPSVGFGIYRDAAVYDDYGNAKGGLRFPMIKVPVASYGEGRYVLTPPHGLDEIVPFSDDVLKSLYSSRNQYVNRFTHAAMRLVQQRYLLPGDAHKLVRQARQADIPE